jgi:aromatic ring-opening dioxygenase catalytic subunit (LigB family)
MDANQPVSHGAGGRIPALFVGHGAAVLTLDERDPTHRWMVQFGEEIAAWRPTAIVCVSAHHEAPVLGITAGERPATLHDHPVRAAYDRRYEAPGSPVLAGRVRSLLGESGLLAELDAARGLDHGAWVPLSLLVPAANLPVVQVSLHASLDPALHLAMGRALAPLRDEGVLLIGSGGVTHDQAEFRKGYLAGADPGEAPLPIRAYDEWVTSCVCDLEPTERSARLARFLDHEGSRGAHPREEHFLPLLVMSGAAEARGSRARRPHKAFQYGLSLSAFVFEG